MDWIYEGYLAECYFCENEIHVIPGIVERERILKNEYILTSIFNVKCDCGREMIVNEKKFSPPLKSVPPISKSKFFSKKELEVFRLFFDLGGSIEILKDMANESGNEKYLRLYHYLLEGGIYNK